MSISPRRSSPTRGRADPRLNRVLPDDLVVWRVAPAPEGFDARFSAIWRRYVYRLGEPDAPGSPALPQPGHRLRHESIWTR